MAEKLKPCPFCGGKANLRLDTGHYIVECPTCHAEIWHWQEEPSDAIADWNRRATTQLTLFDMEGRG